VKTTPVPRGTTIVADPSTKHLAAGRLVGGTPTRMLRLTETGRVAWQELRDGVVGSPASATLARRLTDSGLAHPRPAIAIALDVTVVVPAHGRPAELDRCLASLGDRFRVVVVDDGSPDSERVAAVATRHGARLVRRETNGGPAAARNSGVDDVSTELVAFLDSDCVAPTDWIERLAGHFADPLVAAVAPRIVPLRVGAAYLDRCSDLDLGASEARVHPSGRVTYVPTAALLARRSALEAVGGFDVDLRYGEDVDLVWRLDAAGWRVRYDPSVEIAHDEPSNWRERLQRRYCYGTSAAPLSRRHPGSITHFAGRPLPLAAVVAVIARRPAVATAAVAATFATTGRSLRRAGAADLGEVRATASVLTGTWLGAGRYATQFAAPLLLAALARPINRRRRAVVVGGLALAPPLVDWARSRPAVSPARYVAGRLADDAAYGAGVYAGCARHRVVAPLLPSLHRPS
jgi:mycofactocin glycosyltransferase